MLMAGLPNNFILTAGLKQWRGSVHSSMPHSTW